MSPEELASTIASLTTESEGLKSVNTLLTEDWNGALAREKDIFSKEWEGKVAFLNSEISAVNEQYERQKEARLATVKAQAEVDKKVKEDFEILRKEITALKKQNTAFKEENQKISTFDAETASPKKEIEKLRSDTKVAVRQVRAEVKLEWEKKVAPLTAEVKILEGQKRKLEADAEDTEILKAKYKVMELKLAKAGVVQKDMEIMEAEMNVMQFEAGDIREACQEGRGGWEEEGQD